jgi:pimeloyl-ACP methyl ester carboxylesterase
MIAPQTQFLTAPDGARLAYRQRHGAGRTVVWLGGFRSDMTGSKAAHLDAWAARIGRGFLRFDYFGHGESDGAFAGGTISRWRADSLMAIDALSDGPLVLVGSSMGGWLALLAALARPERVKGLLLIAPAPDFTEKLMTPSLPAEARAALAATGRWERPSPYGDGPYVITQALLDDGARWNLLDAAIPFAGPIRILQGMADADVPWRHATRLMEALECADVRLTLIKAGDHRLSTPDDLVLLEEALEGLLARV